MRGGWCELDRGAAGVSDIAGGALIHRAGCLVCLPGRDHHPVMPACCAATDQDCCSGCHAPRVRPNAVLARRPHWRGTQCRPLPPCTPCPAPLLLTRQSRTPAWGGRRWRSPQPTGSSRGWWSRCRRAHGQGGGEGQPLSMRQGRRQHPTLCHWWVAYGKGLAVGGGVRSMAEAGGANQQTLMACLARAYHMACLQTAQC